MLGAMKNSETGFVASCHIQLGCVPACTRSGTFNGAN